MRCRSFTTDTGEYVTEPAGGQSALPALLFQLYPVTSVYPLPPTSPSRSFRTPDAVCMERSEPEAPTQIFSCASPHGGGTSLFPERLYRHRK